MVQPRLLFAQEASTATDSGHQFRHGSAHRRDHRSRVTTPLLPLACLLALLNGCVNDPEEQEIGRIESVEPTQRQDIDLSRAIQDQTLLVITVRMSYEDGEGESLGCPEPLNSTRTTRSALFRAGAVPRPEHLGGEAATFSGITLLPPPGGVGCGTGSGSHSAVYRLRVTDVAALAAQPLGDFVLVMRPRFCTYYTFRSGRFDASLPDAAGTGCEPLEARVPIRITAVPVAIPGAPSAPTDLAAIPGVRDVRLRWSADTAADSYLLARAPTGGAFADVASMSTPITEYFDTGLEPSTGYTYRLTPRNAAGAGPGVLVDVRTLAATDNGLIAVAMAGNGSGRVTSSPAGIDCPVDCNETYPPGSTVTLTATPAAGQRFAGWSGACSGSEPVLSVLLNGPRECTASFVAGVVSTSTLSLTVSGQGAVSLPAAGLFCRADCSAVLPSGSSVTLTAIPEPGWRVTWSGPPACSSSGASLSLQLTADLSCRAEFSQVPVPGSQWTSVTSPYLGNRQRGRPAIAFNAAGEPTVAFALADAQERSALQVLRWRGGVWTPVGTEVNAGQPSVSGAPALVLRDNGEPVVAWADAPGAIRVASWDGSAWVPLGGNLTVGGNAAPASAPQLEIHGTQLVLSFSEWQGGTARAVLLRSDAGGPWVGGYLPNVGAAGGLLTRLALDVQGAATVLVLGQATLGGELPMRVYEETSAGWQPVCNDVPVRGVTATASYANAGVGFGVQRHRERDGRAIVIGTSVDYRQILAWQCDNGNWVSAAASASGSILAVDNNTRSLLDAVLIPWRNGTGPELLVAISNGYDGSTELVHQYMGFTVFQPAPSLNLARRAQGGSLAAGNIGGGALGIVQGYERGAALELEVWRYGP